MASSCRKLRACKSCWSIKQDTMPSMVQWLRTTASSYRPTQTTRDGSITTGIRPGRRSNRTFSGRRSRARGRSRTFYNWIPKLIKKTQKSNPNEQFSKSNCGKMMTRSKELRRYCRRQNKKMKIRKTAMVAMAAICPSEIQLN